MLNDIFPSHIPSHILSFVSKCPWKQLTSFCQACKVHTLSIRWVSFPHQMSLHHGHLDAGLCHSRWKSIFVCCCFDLFQTFISELKKQTKTDVTVADAHFLFSFFFFSFFYLPASSSLLFPALSVLAVGGIMFLITNMQVQKQKLTLEKGYFCPLFSQFCIFSSVNCIKKKSLTEICWKWKQRLAYRNHRNHSLFLVEW